MDFVTTALILYDVTMGECVTSFMDDPLPVTPRRAPIQRIKKAEGCLSQVLKDRFSSADQIVNKIVN